MAIESAIIEGLSTGGPVAVLAYLIFRMYRSDKKTTENRIHDVHEAHEERLELLLEKDQESRGKQTTALTELTVLIRKLNGRRQDGKGRKGKEV